MWLNRMQVMYLNEVDERGLQEDDLIEQNRDDRPLVQRMRCTALTLQSRPL